MSEPTPPWEPEESESALSSKHVKSLGEYTLLSKIGAGGMGQVFKAEHRRMKRIVALKILPPAAMKSPDAVRRFYREVQAAAKLSHPNIVTAHDAGEASGIHYLVMEYVEGEDLASAVKHHGPLAVPQAIECLVQVARGLAYAHAKGIVHRDIKPANLLVDKEGTVKILDMGLARLDDPLNPDGATAQEGLTSSGQIMGTFDYMSPEQAMDTHRVDGRADIYSLGCTLYRLLTDQNVFGGDTVMQKLMAHREAPIPSLRANRDDVPEEIDLVFARMMAKRPEDRYQSMSEVIAALQTCLVLEESQVGSSVVEAPSSNSNLKFLSELPSRSAGARRQKHDSNDATARLKVGEETHSGVKSLIQHDWASRRVLVGALALTCGVLSFGIWKISSNRTHPLADAPATSSKPEKPPIPGDRSQTHERTKARDQSASRSSSGIDRPVDLLKLIGAKPLPADSKWKLENGILISSPADWTILWIPFTPPDEYTLTAVVERKSGQESLNLNLLVDGVFAHVVFDGWAGSTTGLDNVDGKRAYDNATTRKIRALELNKPTTIVCRVSKTGLQVIRDGEQLLDWTGDSRKSLASEPAAKRDQLMYLNSKLSVFHITKLEISPFPKKGGSANVSKSASPPPLAMAPFTAEEAKQHQQRWADYLNVTIVDTNSIGMKMVLIPPGEFLMGSTPEEIEEALKMAAKAGMEEAALSNIHSEGPQHAVALTKPFLCAATEVTVSQFRKFIDAEQYVTEAERSIAGKSDVKDSRTWRAPGYPVTDDLPVTWVTWKDATAFSDWLNHQEQQDTGASSVPLVASFSPATSHYRLPTEAEWEFACRAGTTTVFSFGNDPKDLDQFGWFNRNSPYAIAHKLPNAFGLFDMHGNVVEWCSDFYDPEWYKKTVSDDPMGPPPRSERVIRGGYWHNFSVTCRSTNRGRTNPTIRHYNLGFRIVRDLDVPQVVTLATPEKTTVESRSASPGTKSSRASGYTE